MSFLRYLRSHWTGSQGFAWSFWVNLVGLRVAISVAQSLVVASRATDALPVDRSLIILLVVAHLAIFVWQAVGVLRAGEHHLRRLGSISSIWGAQFGVLIAVMFVLSDIWSTCLMASPAKDTVSFADQRASERAAMYRLELSDDEKILSLSGDIVLGATKSVAAILAANPTVNTLSLNSNGGNIYEARGLAKLAREAQLNTLAVDVCSSACTIAFIGGKSRRLAPGARLGFHQYRVDATYEVPFANTAAEQQRDRDIYQTNGVEDWFLIQMFQEKSDSIWYPPTAELQRAGVLVSD